MIMKSKCQHILAANCRGSKGGKKSADAGWYGIIIMVIVGGDKRSAGRIYH